MSEFDTTIKVLVVDEYVLMRDKIKKTLYQLGINNVDEVENGIKAFTKLKQNKYDIIFLIDWIMPKSTKFNFIEAIKADTLKNIPVVIISVKDFQDNIMDAVKARIYECIVNPSSINVTASEQGAVKSLDLQKTVNLIK